MTGAYSQDNRTLIRPATVVFNYLFYFWFISRHFFKHKRGVKKPQRQR